MFPPMASLVRSLYKPHKTYNSFIRSDEGLTLATSPFWSFCGDNLIHINSFDTEFSCFTPHKYNTTTYIRFQKDDMVNASNIQPFYEELCSDWLPVVGSLEDVALCQLEIRSLSKDDGYGNDNARKQWPDWLNEEEKSCCRCGTHFCTIFFDVVCPMPMDNGNTQQ